MLVFCDQCLDGASVVVETNETSAVSREAAVAAWLGQMMPLAPSFAAAHAALMGEARIAFGDLAAIAMAPAPVAGWPDELVQHRHGVRAMQLS